MVVGVNSSDFSATVPVKELEFYLLHPEHFRNSQRQQDEASDVGCQGALMGPGALLALRPPRTQSAPAGPRGPTMAHQTRLLSIRLSSSISSRRQSGPGGPFAQPEPQLTATAIS